MKKTIAAVLCMVMLLIFGAVAAAAEKQSMGTLMMNGVFELKCTLPEGYTLEVMANESNQCVAAVKSADPAKAMLMISIAYNELYSDVERLNDLDADSREAIADGFREDDNVEISRMETTHGTEVLVVKENLDTTDYVDFYTIYKGYEVEMVLLHDYRMDAETEILQMDPVTDAEIQMAMTFLSDLDFVSE